MRRRVLLAAGAALAAGCGFKLRGAQTLPIDTLYLALPVNSPLGAEISRVVRASTNARVVTDRGIWVCPILLDAPDGDLGPDLERAAVTPFALGHAACYTCWQYGAICANPGAAAPETAVPSVSGA